MATETLKSRAEFLAIRGGRRASVPSCLIETKPRTAARISTDGPRFGYTVTKKLGNAVVRNRIRRRLKAAVAAVAPDLAVDGHDYVLVARKAALDRPFAEMLADMRRALNQLHKSPQEGAQRLDKPRQQVKKPTKRHPA